MASLHDKQDTLATDASQRRKQQYEALVQAFYNDIFRYAFWLSRSRQQAEDLVQETFLRAWRSLDKLHNPAAAKAWLFTIVRREHARLYERPRPDTDDIDDHYLAEDASAEPDQQMERSLLFKAVASLEAEYRDPLLLQVLGGFSGEEIAAMLGLNSNTVMTRLFRARNKLRQAMAGRLAEPEGHH